MNQTIGGSAGQGWKGSKDDIQANTNNTTQTQKLSEHEEKKREYQLRYKPNPNGLNEGSDN